jgi:hypothetical protein
MKKVRLIRAVCVLGLALLPHARIRGAVRGASLMQAQQQEAPPAQTDERPLALSENNFPDAAVDRSYRVSVQGSGGTNRLRLVLDGDLPPGLTIDTGSDTLAIGGVPTQEGTFRFDVRAIDIDGRTKSGTYSIHVQPLARTGPATIADPEIINVTDVDDIFFPLVINDLEVIHVTDTYDAFRPVVINDLETIHVTDVDALSKGVVINDAETIHVTDTPVLTVQVGVTPATAPPGTYGTGYLIIFSPAGGSATLSKTGAAPPGMNWTTISGNFRLQGTPTQIGSFPFTITATNKITNAVVSVQYTLVINPAILTVTANSFTRPFDQPNPTLTYAITGFVLSDTLAVVTGAPIISTTATPISPAAASPFPISLGPGTIAAPNYVFTFLAGTLTVTSIPQYITFYAIPTLIHGSAAFPLTAQASSGLAVTYSVTGPATITNSMLTVTATGLVTVTATQPGNANFTAAPAVVRSFTAQ